MNGDQAFITQLERQFGKSDAQVFAMASHKYFHHFDDKTQAVYVATLLSEITKLRGTCYALASQAGVPFKEVSKLID